MPKIKNPHRVDTRLADDIQPHDKRHQPFCTCGWSGSDRHSLEGARLAVTFHLMLAGE